MNDGILKIGKKVYYLKYDINALCNMEDFGIDVMKMADSMSFKLVRSLLYFGLQSVHSKEVKSMDKAGELMSEFLEENGIDELINILTPALMKSLGKSGNDVEKK